MLLIRPIAVWLSTTLSRFTARERLLLGWAGLRGAVPIVLGTIVLSESVHDSKTIFNAVFFVVVISALVQGTTLEWVAEKLHVVSVVPAELAPPLEVGDRSSLELVEFDVAPDHAIAGSAVRELAFRGLPWSPSSPAALRPSRRAVAPRSGRATGCTSSPRGRCAPSLTMSSPAGAAACRPAARG